MNLSSCLLKMRSLGGEAVRKAMWLYPKVCGVNPSDRWGHSACCYNGVVYFFGGCCGGLHFSDVLTLNLDTMTWSTLETTGPQPGTRDSHSAVLVGHRMMVFGGTTGSKKVNDLQVLDLITKEWSSPKCEGSPPSPRESHTATLVGDDKLVIFGGTGEGEGNHLNDLHVLDLKIMRWTSQEVMGDIPPPRDSHVAVAIGNKLLVYGGDCGDRYHGAVDVLDMDTLCWSRLVVQGASPGVRAGHAAVTIGTKVFIIGGVRDKLYYNDVWFFDVSTCSWTQLAIRGQQPQGRFSHTAVINDFEIVIYGGCGEDERPLNELLILQLGAEHASSQYNTLLCKTFGSHRNQEKRRLRRGNDIAPVLVNRTRNRIVYELDPNHSLPRISDNLHPRKKRTSYSKVKEIDLEQEEHSLSLSQHSSPSLSDQEQTTIHKLSTSATKLFAPSQTFNMARQTNQISSNHPSNNIAINRQGQNNSTRRTQPVAHFMGGEHRRLVEPRQILQCEPHYMGAEQKRHGEIHSLVGADVRGKVDGTFDSGYLVTANVDGQIMRGVLFTPGPAFSSRVAMLSHTPPTASPFCAQQYYVRPSQQPTPLAPPECSGRILKAQAYQGFRSSPQPNLGQSSPMNGNDCQDVVLTLGGGHSRP